MRKPVGVYFTREAAEFYRSLRNESELKRAIDRGLDILRENMFAGERVKKRLIPKYYIERYGIHNLYRLRLDRKRRLAYTLLADTEGVKVVVLEVFPDHKSYNKRFGYKR